MKLKTTVQKENEIDVPVPSFYKWPDKHETGINHLRAVLDERTICSVYESEARTSVTNEDAKHLGAGDIVEAFINWEAISEQEFLTCYNRALTSMSLTPELIQTNKSNGQGALAE